METSQARPPYPSAPKSPKALPAQTPSLISTPVKDSDLRATALKLHQTPLNALSFADRPARRRETLNLDSPTLPDLGGLVLRDIDRFPHPHRNTLRWNSEWSHVDTALEQLVPGPVHNTTQIRTRLSRGYSTSSLQQGTVVHLEYQQRRITMAVSPTANPSLHLPDDMANRDYSSASSDQTDDTSKPKSPGRFTSFFRWGSSSEQGSGTVSTSLSDRGPSPSLSPRTSTVGKSLPPAIDIPLANAVPNSSDSGISFPLSTASSLEVIEEEVRLVSADLAASIRREMDLEDLVDRLQAEAAERGSQGRRTSDYFSDAGSTPLRSVDGDAKQDHDAEKLIRRVEQEKAQLRVELLEKVHEERERRRQVEAHARSLEEQAAKGGNLTEAPVKIRELEVAIDDAKRRLAEERATKENFEDLLTALREELESHRNERDNLRDEVVPELRARVEGLESEASELQKLMYEHSRMQQELMNLRNENASLAAAMRSQNRQSVLGSPSGYTSPVSNNVSVPLNPKDRESLTERLKDVEAQRDALHSALKSLRDRQQFESRKSKERIKALEMERDRAIHQSPRKKGRDNEVSALRREIDRLRRRADDALEQKFVCERSLGTLKMDLEKAEQETTTLRVLLQEHDDLLSQHSELQESHLRLSMQFSQLQREGKPAEFSSVSLQQAYRDLQAVHEKSLVRLDELESHNAVHSEFEERGNEVNDESRRAIESLRQSLSEAQISRDSAVIQAEAYRKRAESLQKAEQHHLAEERSLSMQLRLSSERVEELAAQVRAQVSSNDRLRERLADAVERGEQEQHMSATRINQLQGRLKALEDRVLEAQHEAEEAVTRHEEEIRQIRETHTSQLRRLKGYTSQSIPKSPMTPLLKSPRLEWTAKRGSTSDVSKNEYLEKRVRELESALSDADNEMAEVVGRMNMAQIEVLELQSERDEAARQTRRLQMEIMSERAKYTGAAQ